MYNNIGLTTPRGSGTSAYVTRNLSHLRPRDDYRTMSDRDMPVKHRAPDAAILEHDRKRKIEVQCLELQDKLEEEGASPEEVEKQVDELRQKLNAASRNASGHTAERGTLKNFQTHEILAAKAVDNERFERAFAIPRDYVEGESLNKERQEERRQQRQLAKERQAEELAERKRLYEEGVERRKLEDAERLARQREERAVNMERNRMAAEARARDRVSHPRDAQNGRDRDAGRMPPPRPRADLVDSYRPGDRDRDDRRRSRSPPPRRAPARGRDRSYSRSPSRSDSRSRSRSRSRSISRSDSRSRSPSRSMSRSRSPPRRRASRGRRSPSSDTRRGRGRSDSVSSRSRSRSRDRRDARSPPPRSRSPPSRRSRSPAKSRDNSPPPRRREASASGSEDMDVQSD